MPQGSVLGPTLFNLFVNDIPYRVISSCVLFADDVLLFRVILSEADEHQLQTDLNSLSDWAFQNRMIFNPSKTKVMHVTRSRNIHTPIYTIDSSPLSSVASVQYLGVTISSDLTWNKHINAIVSRANRLLGFIHSVAGGASTNAFFTLYKSLVLPILEYGIPCWGTHTQSQKQQVERVQRTATRIALKQRRGQMSYEDRLVQLNWLSLSSRRDYLLCSFVYKCLYGICKCESITDSVFVNPRHPQSLTFRRLPARTQALFNSPSRTFPRLWNALPPHIKDSAVTNSLSQFLRDLKVSFHPGN